MTAFKDRQFNLVFGKKDSRDYRLEQFNLRSTENLPDEYEISIVTPVLDQGKTGMCLDFTYRSIEEEQYIAKTGDYEEFANGFLYGQKMFPEMEGMLEQFEVERYTKRGVPFASDFNVVGTGKECKAYFDENITDEIWASAKAHRNRTYVTVDNPDDFIKALLNFGSSGYIGITVYTSMGATGSDGIVPEPSGAKRGGHAMKCKGVRRINGKRYYVVQNSWGTGFGDKGYVYIACDSTMIQTLRVFCDATPENESIRISIGDPVVRALTKNVTMDVAPFIKDDRTFVPLRFISEVLGYKVSWHKGQGTNNEGLVIVEKEV